MEKPNKKLNRMRSQIKVLTAKLTLSNTKHEIKNKKIPQSLLAND